MDAAAKMLKKVLFQVLHGHHMFIARGVLK